jgi:hypothetical protein
MTAPDRTGHEHEKDEPVGLRPIRLEGATHMFQPAPNVTTFSPAATATAAGLFGVRTLKWTPGGSPRQVEPMLVGYGNALLAVLPEPLKLRHGPLLVSVERWSDGNVVARLPAARLYASGRTEAEALSELAADIADLVQDLTEGPHATARLGGAMLETWRALTVFVDAPGLDKPRP